MLSVKDFRRVPGAWPYVVPSKKPQPIDDLQFKDAASGDLAGMLGLQKILQDVSVVPKKFVARCARIVSTPYRPEGWENVDDGAHQSHGHKGLLTTKCEAKPLSVLVIHQSFGPLLIPYLSETFNRVTYAWTDSFKFVKDFVENEQVDVVIQVQVERHLLPDYMHIY
jgi:hypothetical protein